MKFIHTADLHIGKKLHEHSLIEDQKHILKQICALAVAHKVDAVVLAGDIYDRSVPGTEAVELLDDFLTDFATAGIPVIMVRFLSFGHQNQLGCHMYSSRMFVKANQIGPSYHWSANRPRFNQRFSPTSAATVWTWPPSRNSIRSQYQRRLKR